MTAGIEQRPGNGSRSDNTEKKISFEERASFPVLAFTMAEMKLSMRVG